MNWLHRKGSGSLSAADGCGGEGETAKAGTWDELFDASVEHVPV